MERLDTRHIDWLKFATSWQDWSGWFAFSLSHTTWQKLWWAYRWQMRLQILIICWMRKTDIAVYGHVHKQLLLWKSRTTNHQSRNDWYALFWLVRFEKSPCPVCLVRSWRGTGEHSIPKSSLICDYGELKSAKEKGLPFIEMYEELRREDNYPGHNKELLTLTRNMVMEDVKDFRRNWQSA